MATDKKYLWEFVNSFAKHRKMQLELEADSAALNENWSDLNQEEKDNRASEHHGRDRVLYMEMESTFLEDEFRKRYLEYGWIGWVVDDPQPFYLTLRGKKLVDLLAPYITTVPPLVTWEDWSTTLHLSDNDRKCLWIPLTTFIVLKDAGQEGMYIEDLVRLTSAARGTLEDHTLKMLTQSEFVYARELPSALEETETIYRAASDITVVRLLEHLKARGTLAGKDLGELRAGLNLVRDEVVKHEALIEWLAGVGINLSPTSIQTALDALDDLEDKANINLREERRRRLCEEVANACGIQHT